MAKFSFILLAAPLAAAAFITPSAATDLYQDQQSVSVRYDDLNLSSEQGRDRLKVRVKMAINKVCGGSGRRPINERTAVATCKAAAITASDAKLASLFNGKSLLAERGPLVVSAP